MRLSVAESASEDLLSTGEVALLLGSTRQHVVDLCKRGDLPFVAVGTHRRVRRADVERARGHTQSMTRDQRRSLWMSYALAGTLAIEPDTVLARAQENLIQLRGRYTRGRVARALAEWQRLLDGPVEALLETLTSTTPHARELRQNAPFAGVISDSERAQILDAWRTHDRSSRAR